MQLEQLIEVTQNLTLLYVEDNPDAREMTAMIFEEFFTNIIIAEDGEDGYEKFQNHTIDLIITDINMPRMNGLEMIEKIRKFDSEIPVVILSAHGESEFFTESISLGVNGYLLKPLDFDQLTKTIAKITEKFTYMQEAKENLHLLEEYKEATNYGSIVSKTDTKGYITYVNEKFCQISGYSREELIGKPHNIVRHPDNPKSLFEEMWHTIKEKKEIWQGIVKNRTKDGKSYYVDSTVAPIMNLQGETLEYISLRNDITAIMSPLKQLEDELEHASEPLLLLMILRDYNRLADFYSKEKIEYLQREAEKYLEDKFAKHYSFEKLYPLGNGEYALVLKNSQYKHNMKSFIENLKALQEEIIDEKIDIFNNIEYDIAIRISIVSGGEKLLESAKIGLKKLQHSRKKVILANNFAKIQRDKEQEQMRKVAIIQNALATNNIKSYFQAIVDNKTRKVVKYESLVRLINEEGKVLSPFFFLETAKQSNHYLEITQIVLKHSFDALKKTDADISINLSALDIQNKQMRNTIISMLKKHQNLANRVVFELLEDENITDFSITKKFITEIKKYGVKIAIDDFGTGYSNYQRLLDFQPDILKIDGSLIREIETSNYSLSAVKSIVTFAKEQNLEIVAEFIENENIYKIITELGIDYSQGYYFAKPEPLIK